MESSIARNQAFWNEEATAYVGPGRRGWSQSEPTWGIWQVPESDVGALPDVDGADTVELGCGTAYVSAWLARSGARPVGVDPTVAQLATARLLQEEFGLRFRPTLLRPQFGMHRFEWPDDPGVELHLSHGDMIRLLRRSGFEVLDLVEARPGPDASSRCDFVTLDWARQWPSEEIWVARRLRDEGGGLPVGFSGR